jgi:hypothetical protein
LQTTISEEKATSLLKSENAKGVSALQFTKVGEYTTFNAEYTFVDNDIVFHFFLPEELEHKPGAQEYWKTRFPAALDVASQTFWDANYPRLQAAFTEELNSWWLRCFGFGSIGDPEARVRKFLDKLDKQIDKGRG